MVRFCSKLATLATLAVCLTTLNVQADDTVAAPPALTTPAGPAARMDGTGPGWKPLGKDDFVNVNCDESTWTFPDGEIHCTGSPVGVMRTQTELTNFELVVEWRHLKSAGNSGPRHDRTQPDQSIAQLHGARSDCRQSANNAAVARTIMRSESLRYT